MKFNFDHVTIEKEGDHYKVTVKETRQVFYFNPLTWEFVGDRPDRDLLREVCKEIDAFDFQTTRLTRPKNRIPARMPAMAGAI